MYDASFPSATGFHGHTMKRQQHHPASHVFRLTNGEKQLRGICRLARESGSRRHPLPVKTYPMGTKSRITNNSEPT